jgi:disulfide bond formation protein DsbB
MLYYIAWLQAAVATAGSLFFSDVMDLPPCVLCWYQRIAMYPLVVILGIAIVRRDRAIKVYSLPFALGGLATATYHNLLYYRLIPESISPCTAGVSCTTRQVELLGFITIPLLALTAFFVVTVCLAVGNLTRNGKAA